MISMLAGLKVSPLACACAFYRSEQNAKALVLNLKVLKCRNEIYYRIETWTVDEKNGGSFV